MPGASEHSLPRKASDDEHSPTRKPEDDASPTKGRPTSWIQDLLDRRVPQILGLYLGASWGIVQFVVWLTDRYGLAENLPEIALVTTLSLVPTAAILAYFHGHPSRIVGSRWTRVEKIGIPANLVVTAILLLSVVGGERADATTRAVTVRDETGREVERLLPNREYRKSLAIFNFDNATGDPELAWVGDALATALAIDLLQDLLFDIRMPLSSEPLRDKARDAGFVDGTGLPLALQRKIARDLHLGYFVRGGLERKGDVYSVRTTLYESQHSKLLAERVVEGEDLFAVIDRLATSLRTDVGLPADHVEGTEDLPVAEILTRSLPALELFGRASRAMLYDRDLETASALLTRAVEEDPTFATAAFLLSELCAESNQNECTRNYLDLTMEHLYKLPDRFQYEVKEHYYFYNEEHDKRLRLIEMRAELFPEDIDVHLQLADLHSRRNAWDEALGHYRRALELAAEPELYYRSVASVYARKGDVEQAREHYRRYVDRFPDEAAGYLSLGRFLEQVGDPEAARSNYERALLLEPGNLRTLLELGDVELQLGHSEVARAQYDKALGRSEQPEDRAAVYQRLEQLHRVRGQTRLALEYLELGVEELAKVLPPRDLAVQRLLTVHRYVEAGQEDTAQSLIAELAAELEPPVDRLAVIGYVRIYNEVGDVPRAQETLRELEEVFEDLGDEVRGLQPFLFFERGRTLEAQGKLDEAIAEYRRAFEVDRSNRQFHYWIGRAQRKAGRFEDARESLEEALRAFAYDPKIVFEQGLTHLALGEMSEAREYLARAVEMWSDADPDYRPAVEARARLAELAPGS